MNLQTKFKKHSAVDLALETMSLLFYSVERGTYSIHDVQMAYNCWNVATFKNERFVAVTSAVEEWVELAKSSRPVSSEDKEALEELITLIG